MTHRRQPPVAVVGRGRHPDLRPALVHRPTGERHAVLPADEAAHPRRVRQLHHAEVVARADAVEHALVHRRHQLPVTVQQTVRADDQQRVVERPRPVVLALVDPDRDVDVAVAARLRELVHQRAAHVDARRPHALPQLVAAPAPRRRGRRPRAARIQRHEALGEHDQRRAVVGRVAHQVDGLGRPWPRRRAPPVSLAPPRRARSRTCSSIRHRPLRGAGYLVSHALWACSCAAFFWCLAARFSLRLRPGFFAWALGFDFSAIPGRYGFRGPRARRFEKACFRAPPGTVGAWRAPRRTSKPNATWSGPRS